MKKILFILEAGDVYMSGTMRLMYADHFKAHGDRVRYVSYHVVPIARLINKPPRILFPLYALGFGRFLSLLEKPLLILKRSLIVHLAKRHDVVILSKIISRRLIQDLRRQTKAKLILDFGDALWLPAYNVPDFSDILADVDAVTTDNENTASFVKRFNPACFIVPDSPQIELFDQKRFLIKKAASPIVLGWVGSPSTAYNLYVIWEALERVFAQHSGIELRLLGVGRNRALWPRFERVKASIVPFYTQEQMIDEVLKMHVGLFPLQDTECSHARGILKATVYMSGQAAVISSAIGQSVRLIQNGVNGLLAASTAEWEAAMDMVLTNAAKREQIAAAGLDTVRKNFTLDRCFEAMASAVETGR